MSSGGTGGFLHAPFRDRLGTMDTEEFSGFAGEPSSQRRPFTLSSLSGIGAMTDTRLTRFRGQWRPYLVSGALLLACVLHATGAVWLNTTLQAGDQGAYLQLSLAQREGRAFTDGNRHPLYPALLIPLAERDPRFFARARWISFLIGISFLLFLAGQEWRLRKDPIAALLVLAFLGSHVQMIRTLSEVWCEPLLYLLVYWLWARCEAITDHSDDQPSRCFRLRHGVICGLLAGLIYLTKGTGLQVAVLFWLTAIIFAKPRMPVLVGIAVFAAVISPLLIWNMKTYGTPLYSFASTHNMWFDEADEIWYDNPADLPTLGSYLRTHAWKDILTRLIQGLALETRMAGQLLWTDWTVPEGTPPGILVPHALLKIIPVGLVISGFLSRWRGFPPGKPLTTRSGWTFFCLLLVVLLPSFGWYAQLTDEPRFLMMLIPIAVVIAARAGSQGVSFLLAQFENRGQHVVRTLLTGLVGCYAGLLLLAATGLILRTYQLPPPKVSALALRTLAELSLLPEGSTVAYGPSHGLPLWMARHISIFRPTPWRIDWEGFLRMIEREKIGYVLVDRETVARRPYLAPLLKPGAGHEWKWELLSLDRDPEDFFLLYKVGGGNLTPSP
jgi:hypothetical protein